MTQETDRELMELAAKAADIDVEISRGKIVLRQSLSAEKRIGCIWNPLTDDGDALRLAVKLEMQIVPGYRRIDACIVPDGDDPAILVSEIKTDDLYADTRRAIVRAAAEIGKAM